MATLNNDRIAEIVLHTGRSSPQSTLQVDARASAGGLHAVNQHKRHKVPAV